MRVLIVDDEPINRFMLAHILEESGYTDLYEAENGREAVLLAEKIEPDLVLLDIVMPEMDGYEAARRLKQQAGDIYLPIIFITAFDNQENLVRCLEAGGDDFASKPFDKLVLKAKILAHARTRMLSKKIHAQNAELTFFRHNVEREHAIIEHIFNNALTIDKRVESYFDFRLEPASSFNGDMFLAAASPSGGLYFLMGDFTGHGLASAIGALPVTRAFHAMASKGLSIMEMSQTLNTTVYSLLPVEMFFAATLVEIASNGCHLTVWNGGMPDLVVLMENGALRKRFASNHMPLGILEDDEFEDDVERFDMQPGDRLLGWTDGVLELGNDRQDMLGEERMLGWLHAKPDISLAALREHLDTFRGEAPQKDDITLMSFVCQGHLGIQVKPEFSNIPFEIEVALDAAQLRTINPVQEVVAMIATQAGLQHVRSDVSVVLNELFVNALDHGLLKLDSSLKNSTEGFFHYFQQRSDRLETLSDGFVKIGATYHPDTQYLTLTVEDSGDGFDLNIADTEAAEHEADCFGRGIALVKALCHSLDYEQRGTRVVATFLLQDIM